MTKARAKIWARLIRKGQKTLEEVAEENRNDVRAAYYELFGEHI